MINTYLNDVQAFGEDGEYEGAKETLIDFLLYFQSMEDDDFIDGVDEFYQTWNPDLGSDYDDYNDED